MQISNGFWLGLFVVLVVLCWEFLLPERFKKLFRKDAPKSNPTQISSGLQVTTAYILSAPKNREFVLGYVLLAEGPKGNSEPALFVIPLDGMLSRSGPGMLLDVNAGLYLDGATFMKRLPVYLCDIAGLLGDFEQALETFRGGLRLFYSDDEKLANYAHGRSLQSALGWYALPSWATFEPPSRDMLPEKFQLCFTIAAITHTFGSTTDVWLEQLQGRVYLGSESVLSDKPAFLQLLAFADSLSKTRPDMGCVLIAGALGEDFCVPDPLAEEMRESLGQLLNLWGVQLRRTGELARAVHRFEQGLQVSVWDEARQEMHYNRGYARLQQYMRLRHEYLGPGQVVGSLFEFPDKPRALCDLLLSLEDFEQASRLNPNDAQAWNQRALTCEQLAFLEPKTRKLRLEQALQWYRKARDVVEVGAGGPIDESIARVETAIK